MPVLTSYIYLDVFVSLSILAVTALYYYLTANYHYWSKRNVPFEKPSLFFGNFYNVFAFNQSPGQFFGELYRKSTGKLYGFFIIRRPYVLIRDPELIKNVLVKDFGSFSDRSNGIMESDPVGTANLFNIKNPHWKFMRTKLSPLFTSGKLKEMFPLINEIGEQLNEYLNEKNKLLSEEEVKEYCAKYTTDVIASTSFGIVANSLRDNNAEFRNVGRKLFTYTLWRSWELTCYFFAPNISNLLNFKLFSDEGTEFLRNLFWRSMKIRETNKIERHDVIDAMMKIKNTGTTHDAESDLKPTFKFAGDNLVAQVAVFFTAGFETTSSSISFTLYELALQRNLQTRLRAEIRSVLNGQPLKYEHLAEMKYLDQCVSETLRLYPTLPFLDRECTAPYTFPGTDVTIEPGTVISISLDGLHRDPLYFENPNQYDPERWSEENRGLIKPYTYMPFGEGPHNCIGMRFGLISTKVGLISILKDFEVSPSDRTEIPLRIDPKAFLAATISGIYLNVQKINL